MYMQHGTQIRVSHNALSSHYFFTHVQVNAYLRIRDTKEKEDPHRMNYHLSRIAILSKKHLFSFLRIWQFFISDFYVLNLSRFFTLFLIVYISELNKINILQNCGDDLNVFLML